ncbi:MAG: chromosomal replication initiator protein DnaA [Dehalococcoidales bacterium]|nr:chromosomal replication initiator protein DnaA [Dehalococcoidales bacterium]
MNAKQIWQAALGELQIELSRPVYETYLKRTVLVRKEGDAFVIGAPSTFIKEWIEERLQTRIAATLSRIVGERVEVRVTVHQRRPRSSSPSQQLELEPHLPEAGPSGEPSPKAATDADSQAAAAGTVLNPRYTFDKFIVGKSNQLAHAAAMAVADRPGLAYNPLFIYGAVGLGKTHLLHAIGHSTRSRGLEVTYVTSERFTNDLISSIREHRSKEFRQRYRQSDVLLIDDIQFIAGKDSTQEEFFHTFNALHEANKQLVICSDRPPKSIATLEERLRSRFEWGLIADIQPPDYEHRVAILREKAKELGLKALPTEVVEYVARAAQSSIRELEGSLNRVLALANLTNRPLTLDLARAALSDLTTPVERRFITPQLVVEVITRFYKLDPRVLRGKQRDKEVVLPRQVAMYLLRKETDCSLAEIGRELGGRDHSTVLHGCDRIHSEIEVDSRLRSDVAEITQLLYSESRR